MDTHGKVTRPAETILRVHKGNDGISKESSVYDAIPENEISSREDTHVGQLPASVHCSDYLQQTLSDLMQLNPDDFVINGDQQRQFSHHVLQGANSETVESGGCASDTVGSTIKETTSGYCSGNISQSTDIKGKNSDTDDTYYSHIYDCIVCGAYPEGYSESYHTALKKRARHYCVLNGTLYYNHKQPREVVIKKHHQQKILQNAHIENETGIHLGVKRMHETINKTYFWRGMYMDITTFVRNCHICFESFSGQHIQSSAQCKLGNTHENDSDENHFVNNENSVDKDFEIRNKVWQKVLVKVCGPFPKTSDDNEYLITIVDPVSMWVCVKPTTCERNIKAVASFIIKIFCLLGFAECCFLGFTTKELESVQNHYKGDLFESKITSCMFGSKSRKRSQTEEHESDECSWSTNLLNDFVSCYPSDWDKKIQSFLHNYHVSIGHDSLSPFYKLHGRNPKFIVEENKENTAKDTPINKVPAVFSARGKSQNSVLQCQQSNQIFTSKKSYQIPQKDHIERTQQSETLLRDDWPLFHRKFRRKNIAEVQQDNAGSSVQADSVTSADKRAHLASRNQPQKIMKLSQPSEIRANTIAHVMKLLESAKEKQRKRGKYHKYSPEIREQIAQYVAEKGAGEAARCFSEKLGRVVSESTVRNIYKLHSSYTPDLKQEIGKYAVIHGVQATSDHFTHKLGFAIRLGIVHKFKRFYLSQIPKHLKKKIHKERSNVNRKRHYSDELKEEIGNYAFKYTVGATIQHYSRKLGYAITETVVRRFRKMYLQKTFEQQSSWKQKQGHMSVQQKEKQQQYERVQQQQTYLNIQENPFREQMEQSFPQNHIHERCAQSTDVASEMQTINILHSSMSVLNDPQFSGSPNAIFPSPREAAAVSSNCTSFDQHTTSVLDIQPYVQCNGSIPSSSLVYPSQFNHVSTDPSTPIQDYQHNDLYSYYSEQTQQGDLNSASGNNYISSLQLQPLSHFSGADLANKTISALDGTPTTSRKQRGFHIPNSNSLATDGLVSQIHSVLSQNGDVLFQQEGIQQLSETNATIKLNSDQVAEQNTDNTKPIIKHSGDNSQLHTSPLHFSVSHNCTKTSTEYSVNTLFDDQNNTFLLPPRGDGNISIYSKYNEVKEPNISCSSAQAIHEVNSINSSTFMQNESVKSVESASDVINGHSYSVQCSSNAMCSLSLKPLEPVLTNGLQLHETSSTLKSQPIRTLSSQNSEQQSPLYFVTSSINGSATQKLVKTSTTPVSVEYASSLHPQLITNMKPLTSDLSVSPADEPVTSLTTSFLKEKGVGTSCTTYPSCSVSLLKETMSSGTTYPFLVQPHGNQPTPLYTVAPTASSTTTKSVTCTYAITLTQEEKKKLKIPLMYFSQSQLSEPPPLVALSQSKTTVEKYPSQVTVFPVMSATETLCAIDPVSKIPPLAVLSHSTPNPQNESNPLQNSAITNQSHSSGKQPPAYQPDMAHTVSQQEKLKTLKALNSSEDTLDQSTDNQSKLSHSDLVHPVATGIISSVISNSTTDNVKNKFNSMQDKIVLSAGSSLSLHSVNNLEIMQNRNTISQSASSMVVLHQTNPIPEVVITQAVIPQTQPNSVGNIPLNTTVSATVQNTNTLAVKQNLPEPTCSDPVIVRPKIGSSSNVSVTSTPSSASIVSVQALMATSDLKHILPTTPTNSHVIVRPSQTSTVSRPKMSTVLISSPVTTTIPVNSVPASTPGNIQSGVGRIPIIIEYHTKQKPGIENRPEFMANFKYLAACKSKDEIHNTSVTLSPKHNLNSITVASSNTPIMSHKLTVPCSSTALNFTSTGATHITSNFLTTSKSSNSRPCHTGSIYSRDSSWNDVTKIPSSYTLSGDTLAMSSSGDALATATTVSTMLSDRNCSSTRSTSLLTNTSANLTATSSIAQIFLDKVCEICPSRALVNHPDPTSDCKNSSSFTDKGCQSSTSGCCAETIYPSGNSSNSKVTSLSGKNSVMRTVRVSPSNDVSTCVDARVPDITTGDEKHDTVAVKNSRKKPCKRGNYCMYSPELRAEMGKYAVEHGSEQACLHFKRILGVEIPSGTMRTLRDKYLQKLAHCTRDQKILNKGVTSLGYVQRGRPMRLGKYDEEVQRCIKEIVKTGEPVSSYLVIETARQVLLQYDPSLLEENGGNIKLNVTWAKSFLRRTGLRNNS